MGQLGVKRAYLRVTAFDGLTSTIYALQIIRNPEA